MRLRQLGDPSSVWQRDALVDFVSNPSLWLSVPKEANNFYGADGSFEAIGLFLDGLGFPMGPNFITKNTLITSSSIIFDGITH